MDLNFTNCTYEPMPFLEMKFVIVGVFGTLIAVLGMFLNGLAFAVLKGLVFNVSSPLIYLLVLAVLDFLFMGIYILAMSVQIYFDFYENLPLYWVWNGCISYVMTLGKINQTASTYLLVAATVERMMDVGGFVIHVELKNSHRALVIAGVILFAIAFRLACFWELNVVEMSDCSGFARFALEQHDFSLTPSYQVYNFYVVNIVQVYVPFGLLLVGNVLIVRSVRKAIGRQTKVFRRESVWRCANEQENLRTATNILITAVSMYLLANLLNVVISIIEYTNRDFLDSNPQFYTFSVDCIGLLQIATSACRLIICIIWSERLRIKLLNIFGVRKGPIGLHQQENTLLATTLCLLTMQTAATNGGSAEQPREEFETFINGRNSVKSPLPCLRNATSFDSSAKLLTPKSPEIWIKSDLDA